MNTQQALTTKQVEILILLEKIERFKKVAEEEITVEVGEILVSNYDMSDEELEENIEILQFYGYINEEYELTIDGKQ